MDPSGAVVFSGDDVRAGQEVFLKYGLMDNGSIWGHGGYLGPDFSAAVLHEWALELARQRASLASGKNTPRFRPRSAPPSTAKSPGC